MKRKTKNAYKWILTTIILAILSSSLFAIFNNGGKVELWVWISALVSMLTGFFLIRAGAFKSSFQVK